MTDALLRIVPEAAEFQWSRAELDAQQAQALAAEEKLDEAVSLYQASIHQKEELVRRSPDAVHWKLALGKSFAPLALIYEKAGDFDEAAAVFRKGIDILQSLENNAEVAEEVAVALQSSYFQMSSHMLQRILVHRNPNYD